MVQNGHADRDWKAQQLEKTPAKLSCVVQPLLNPIGNAAGRDKDF
jgi:hypothetical protein